MTWSSALGSVGAQTVPGRGDAAATTGQGLAWTAPQNPSGVAAAAVRALQVRSLLAQLQDCLRRAETERDRALQQLRGHLVQMESASPTPDALTAVDSSGGGGSAVPKPAAPAAAAPAREGAPAAAAPAREGAPAAQSGAAVKAGSSAASGAAAGALSSAASDGAASERSVSSPAKAKAAAGSGEGQGQSKGKGKGKGKEPAAAQQAQQAKLPAAQAKQPATVASTRRAPNMKLVAGVALLLALLAAALFGAQLANR